MLSGLRSCAVLLATLTSPLAWTAPSEPAASSKAQAGPGAEVLFAGCSASSHTYMGWKYECEGLTLDLNDQTPAEGERSWKDRFGNFRNRVNGPPYEEESRTLGGRPARVAWFPLVSGGSGAQRGWAKIALVEVAGQGSRSIGCMSHTPGDEQAVAERCERMLAVLAGQDWLSRPVAGVRVKPATLVFANRKLDLPQQCEGAPRVQGARLDCGQQSAMKWRRVEDAAQRPAAEQAHVEEARRSVPGKGGLTETRVPCSISGVKTQCLQLARKGSNASVYVGSAEIREAAYYVTCSAGSRGPEGLVACGPVLRLE